MKRQTRKQTVDTLQQEQWDVLVIGGGITGAGITLDAASRGMKTALVEMEDFAHGTSSRSTKLVHGGLRYLKQFEIKEVADLGRERAVVYENGPHITTPVRMLLPFYKGGTFGYYSTALGLTVYDTLAQVKKSERRTMHSKEEVLEKAPILKSEGLKGGGLYVEYRTDDARLTIEVVKRAEEYGAMIANYTKVDHLLYDETGQVVGAHVVDRLTDTSYDVFAKVVVNAAGPWVDDVREMDGSKVGKHLQLSKGVHLVFDESTFPLQQAIYFDTPDGRMVFAIPRQGKTYVGTTDTFYEGDPKRMTVTEEDRAYLLKAIGYIFPSIDVTEADIESSWAGVRPLIHEEGKNPSEISRKDEVWESESGLLTIAGGKLTGYRAMAVTIVDRIVKRFKKEEYKLFGPSVTKELRLSGGDVGGADHFETFVAEQVEALRHEGWEEDVAERLVRLYGSNVRDVTAYAHDNDTDLPNDLYAQLRYGIDAEFVMTPTDFFARRTGELLFHIDRVRTYEEEVVRVMKDIFDWDEPTATRHRARLALEMERATTAVSE
ncbi:FAD-dependent oxidoreductase [Planococcaceae bacterium Storch 2/2-2]|nr:FAD-dependent oxidoreductase [Planococcaceae bacterium Storch 2/2-2]